MGKMKIVLLFIWMLLSGLVKSQTNLSIQAIPDSLKNNAYSVVRLNNTEFTWQSMETGEERNISIITILNDKGKDEANFQCYCDKFSDLKKFSGEVYDANGKLIRKIKKSELKFTEYSPELASDSKIYYMEFVSSVYPFTIKYEWETKDQKGLIGFPVFIPQTSFNQSVEKAEYIINLPDGVDFKHKAINMPDTPKKSNTEKGIKYQWSLENIPAIESEPLGPSFIDICPRLYATPIDFIYDSSNGNMNDWQSFGKWQSGLLSGRDILPDKQKQLLTNLTKDTKNDREKVKKVYDYLAENTRYVSIQLGIGGLQPMSANEVCTTGFGDCKGLSNYMKAMLQAIGIPSSYTAINTKNKRLFKDFSSANQMNHVILQVPLPQDTLWLECTNPQLPFGYIHSNIAGHDALLIKENGGEIHTLPSYPDSLNTENNHINIILSEDGNMSGQVNYTAKLFQYESLFGFTELPANEQIDHLRNRIKLSQAKVSDLHVTEDKSNIPSINITYNINSGQYGNKTGNRIFMPVNTFRNNLQILKNKERKNDIFISYGYKDCDSICIQIPDNYTVEALPKPILMKRNFGTFYSLIYAEDNKIIIQQSLIMTSGRYQSTDYASLCNFRKEISNAYNAKIILKKKNE